MQIGWFGSSRPSDGLVEPLVGRPEPPEVRWTLRGSGRPQRCSLSWASEGNFLASSLCPCMSFTIRVPMCFLQNGHNPEYALMDINGCQTSGIFTFFISGCQTDLFMCGLFRAEGGELTHYWNLMCWCAYCWFIALYGGYGEIAHKCLVLRSVCVTRTLVCVALGLVSVVVGHLLVCVALGLLSVVRDSSVRSLWY